MIDKEEKIGAECELLRETLSAYLDGECEEHEAQKIKAHIESCAECRALYERFSEMSYNINNIKTTAPADLHSSIMKAVADARAQEKPKKSFYMRVRKISTWCGAGVAALICIALLGGPLFNTMNDMGLTGKSVAMEEADRSLDIAENDGATNQYSNVLDDSSIGFIYYSDKELSDGAEAPTEAEKAKDCVKDDSVLTKTLCENTAADDECQSIELQGLMIKDVLPRRGVLKERR